MQSLNRMNNQQYRQSVSRSGNSLAGVVQSGINFGNVDALNKFAGQDAQMKQANIRYLDSFTPQFQHIQDVNQQIAYDMYKKNQSSSGQLLNSGISNALWASSMNNSQAPTDGIADPNAGSAGFKTGQQSSGNVGFSAKNDPIQYDAFGNQIYSQSPSQAYNPYRPTPDTYGNYYTQPANPYDWRYPPSNPYIK